MFGFISQQHVSSPSHIYGLHMRTKPTMRSLQPAGFYNDRQIDYTKSQPCLQCPTGTTTAGQGSTRASDCNCKYLACAGNSQGFDIGSAQFVSYACHSNSCHIGGCDVNVRVYAYCMLWLPSAPNLTRLLWVWYMQCVALATERPIVRPCVEALALLAHTERACALSVRPAHNAPRPT